MDRYSWLVAHGATLCAITIMMLKSHENELFATNNFEYVTHVMNHFGMSSIFLFLRSVLMMRVSTDECKLIGVREELAMQKLPINCEFYQELKTAHDLWCHLLATLERDELMGKPSSRKQWLTWVASLLLFSVGGILINPWIAIQPGESIIIALLVVADLSHASYLEPMFTAMAQHFWQKRKMMNMLTDIIALQTAVTQRLPHLNLADRSNVEAWFAMRLGVTRWFLLPDLHRSEGLLAGMFITEIVAVIGIVLNIVLRWVALLWFSMVGTLTLLSFIVGSLFDLLQLSTAVKAQVTAIHDTKVQQQLRGKCCDQADRDFLEVSTCERRHHNCSVCCFGFHGCTCMIIMHIANAGYYY